MEQTNDVNKKKSFKDRVKVFFNSDFGITITMVILFFPGIIFWVWAVANKDWGIDLTGQNAIGDAVGGITAPFIGTTTSVLTFLAFWVQYKFNKKQLDFNMEQNVFNKKQIEFAENQEKFNKMQLIESKVASLNHTFDQLKISDYDKNQRELLSEFNKFYHAFCIQYQRINVLPVDSNEFSKQVIRQFINTKYSNQTEKQNVEHKLNDVFNTIHKYAHFIFSLQYHLMEETFNERKKYYFQTSLIKYS